MAATAVCLALAVFSSDWSSLYDLYPDVYGPERTAYFHHIYQFLGSGEFELDAISAGMRNRLGKAKLCRAALDPRNK